LTIERMCQLVPVSRTGFYRSLQEQRPVEEEMEVRSAIQQIELGDRLEMHRLSSGNPESGPVFVTGKGTHQMMNNLLGRVMLPALIKANIEWHGWHACRRGLGSNLYRLRVSRTWLFSAFCAMRMCPLQRAITSRRRLMMSALQCRNWNPASRKVNRRLSGDWTASQRGLCD